MIFDDVSGNSQHQHSIAENAAGTLRLALHLLEALVGRMQYGECSIRMSSACSAWLVNGQSSAFPTLVAFISHDEFQILSLVSANILPD